MVRIQRSRPSRRPRTSERVDQDDPDSFSKMPVPDKESAEFTRDQVDQFHDHKISELLACGVQMDSDDEDVGEEEEVMALDDSGEEEEVQEEEEGKDMESDLENKINEDIPNELAWGWKKKMFYNSDYVQTRGKKVEVLEAEEQEEEEEARNIQQRLASNLTEDDYDLSFLQEFTTAAGEGEEKAPAREEKIIKDLQQMPRKEKMKLLKKESPELLELIEDFKTKLTELKDELQPLVQTLEDGKIPEGKGANYLRTKQQLYLNYCTNISFYLVLKAKRLPAHNHPVIERLLIYRNLINGLAAVDTRLTPEFRRLLAEEGNTKEAAGAKKGQMSSRKEKGSSQIILDAEKDSDLDLDEEAALRFYKEAEKRVILKRNNKNPEALEPEDGYDDDEELTPEAKRGITYQMAKNKGLTPKRKKIDRNPRVKHREKYRRAKIRRKGQVQQVRCEETKYSGELSGIRAGVKKSVKLH